MDEAILFELNFNGTVIKIQRHFLSSQTIFHVVFPDKRKPLVITRTLDANATRFWTSIPEGRQKEAEEIGPLIASHLLKK